MGFFSTSPEIKLEKEKIKKEKERLWKERQFAASPAGQARVATGAGMKVFQCYEVLAENTASAGLGCSIISGEDINTKSNMIQSVEEEGWRLEHADYVYRMLGSESSNRMVGSGQTEAVSGEIIGIYIFRAIDNVCQKRNSKNLPESDSS